MNSHPIVELQLYLLGLFALAIPAGLWIKRAMTPMEEKNWTDWKQYAKSLIVFHILGTIVLYTLLRFQTNSSMAPDLAFNTAISFVTNTNWQAYAGETGVSPFVQMFGLAVQNFLSAATGIAVAFALMRAFTRNGDGKIGNFQDDIWRAVVYILLPGSFIAAIILLSQGTPQSFDSSITVTGIQGQPQTIAIGPIASQEAIKMLGTNGGGYFNANSVHPFENPNPFTNFVQMLLIFLIPASLLISFGRLIKDMKQGVAILISMTILFMRKGSRAVILSHSLNG